MRGGAGEVDGKSRNLRREVVKVEEELVGEGLLVRGDKGGGGEGREREFMG